MEYSKEKPIGFRRILFVLAFIHGKVVEDDLNINNMLRKP